MQTLAVCFFSLLSLSSLETGDKLITLENALGGIDQVGGTEEEDLSLEAWRSFLFVLIVIIA